METINTTPAQLAAAVDELASIRAQIAELKAQEETRRLFLIMSGHAAIDGELHRATISTTYKADPILGPRVVSVSGDGSRAAMGWLMVDTLNGRVHFHSNFEDRNQLIHFMKNLAIVGGFLQLVVLGAGCISLDSRKNRSSIDG